VPAYNGACAQISLLLRQIFTLLFYTPKQIINICGGVQHSVGIQWEHVSDCGSTVRRSVISASLTSTYPAGGTATFIAMHVTWVSVLDRCQISLDWQRVIEINARATAVELRPTAVSEGRPANRCVVQWQRAQRRWQRLKGFFDHD